MGMNACILAFGPYTPKIAGRLEYSADAYVHAPPGGIVFSELLNCVTSTASRDLAEAFGVEPWSLGNHQIRREYLQPAALRAIWETLRHHSGIENTQQDMNSLAALTKQPGWQFFYRPNG